MGFVFCSTHRVSEFKILENVALTERPSSILIKGARIEGIETRQIRDSVGNDLNIDVEGYRLHRPNYIRTTPQRVGHDSLFR